ATPPVPSPMTRFYRNGGAATERASASGEFTGRFRPARLLHRAREEHLALGNFLPGEVYRHYGVEPRHGVEPEQPAELLHLPWHEGLEEGGERCQRPGQVCEGSIEFGAQFRVPRQLPGLPFGHEEVGGA